MARWDAYSKRPGKGCGKKTDFIVFQFLFGYLNLMCNYKYKKGLSLQLFFFCEKTLKINLHAN